MIASAVSSEGVRSPERSRDIVEWLTPVRIANARWLIPRSCIASRSHPQKSPCNTRLGRVRSSTGWSPRSALDRHRSRPSRDAEEKHTDGTLPGTLRPGAG